MWSYILVTRLREKELRQEYGDEAYEEVSITINEEPKRFARFQFARLLKFFGIAIKKKG